MRSPMIAEFRKSLSAAHRRKISNSLKRRNKGVDQEDKLGAGIDKGVLRITHLTNSANNATKAYYNVARGAKDFQLVRKYRDARRMAAIKPTRLQSLGRGLDATLGRSEAASRITSRLTLIPLRFPRNVVRTKSINLLSPNGRLRETTRTVSRMARLF